jgi:hypothetical protein
MLLCGCSGAGKVESPAAASGGGAAPAPLRWAGSFMNASGTSGGTMRMVVDQSGRVRGSMNDSVWTHDHSASPPRVGTVSGTLGPGQDIALTVHWSDGGSESYSGAWSHPSPASLGADLKANTSSSQSRVDQITLSLHEQGVAGSPPYGVPKQSVMPDFQKQWTGTWTVNWYDGGADWGTGSVRVTSAGVLNGSLADDGFNSTQWNQAVSATMSGTIGPDGSTTATVTWSDGRAPWSMSGKAYFTNPEQFQINFTPTDHVKTASKSITVTFMRGQ